MEGLSAASLRGGPLLKRPVEPAVDDQLHCLVAAVRDIFCNAQEEATALIEETVKDVLAAPPAAEDVKRHRWQHMAPAFAQPDLEAECKELQSLPMRHLLAEATFGSGPPLAFLPRPDTPETPPLHVMDPIGDDLPVKKSTAILTRNPSGSLAWALEKMGEVTGKKKKVVRINGSRRTVILDGKPSDGLLGGSCFIDADAMKERVRETIKHKPYNVADKYHNDGWFQRIAKSTLFETMTLAVISFNAIWIAVDLDLNDATILTKAHPMFQIAEHSFCFYFFCEIIIRFGAFRDKSDCLKDAWFVFDSTLVLLMIFETWILTFATTFGSFDFASGSILKIARLVRLTRMARLARIMRAIPELVILIKGIWVATRSVFFTLALLLIIVYVFAIAFKQLATDHIYDEYFRTVPVAAVTLLLYAVLPDFAPIVIAVGEHNLGLGLLISFFILISSLTVMNMLVGVLVEVVGAVSSVEKETAIVCQVRSQLTEMLTTSKLDADNDGMLSRSEFENLLLEPQAAKMIQEVGVDVVGLVDLSDFIFKEKDEISYGDFMELVMQLRGNNAATMKDIVDMKKFVKLELEKSRTDLAKELFDKITTVSDAIQAMQKDQADALEPFSPAATMQQVQQQAALMKQASFVRQGRQLVRSRRAFQNFHYMQSDSAGIGAQHVQTAWLDRGQQSNGHGNIANGSEGGYRGRPRAVRGNTGNLDVTGPYQENGVPLAPGLPAFPTELWNKSGSDREGPANMVRTMGNMDPMAQTMPNLRQVSSSQRDPSPQPPALLPSQPQSIINNPATRVSVVESRSQDNIHMSEWEDDIVLNS
eukprot:TRINITY_DN37152_c1_g1_i1.p1 TRINITY_DN37152_c1_g1~~TRINITY_DN37152_c1_g1_i1.p1  ORF type:complete len:819 (+),score=218.32 TRINITY_DN37152_c1_g1_i1:111-2567(+)